MRQILWITIFLALLVNGREPRAADAAEVKIPLTVWLIPFDPPFAATWKEERLPIKKQLSAFNRRWAAQNLTILNTTVDWMVDQLVVWNPEYDLPNWSVVRGQERTLEALARFAEENRRRVVVRFVRWKSVISELKKMRVASDGKNPDRAKKMPDVVQIGSTWAAYVAKNRISLSPSGNPDPKFSWRRIDDEVVSLPYTIDVRLLFFWKKLPGSRTPFTENLEQATDWRGIVERLSRMVQNHHNPAPPMVLPTGLTFDLFHDYVPLVWASGVPFFKNGFWGIRTGMNNQQALKVPLFISKHASTVDAHGRAYRIFAFPEMGQETAARHFMNGLEYVAVIQPAAFISRWRRNFMRYISADSKDFWDCAGLTVPPAVFKGGSDLMVVNGTKQRDAAFQLVRFLATDTEHSGIAGENGYLPAQSLDFGLNALLNFLGGPSSEHAKKAVLAIYRAIDAGREYPPIARLPDRVESVEMLEAMQGLWRRLGEGDAAHVRKAAGDVALKINAILYWPATVWVIFKKLWPAMTLILALFFMGLYLQSRKIARRNRLLRIAVDSLRRRDYVLISRAGAFVSDCGRRTEDAREKFSNDLHDLRARTLRLEENIRKDLEQPGKQIIALAALIQEAWENALSQYRLAFPGAARPPESPVTKEPWESFAVGQMPYLMVAMLQDWFYNTLKNDAYALDGITVRLWRKKGKSRGLCVCSPHFKDGPVSVKPYGPLPTRVYERMYEQSKSAYGRYPIIREVEERRTGGMSLKSTALFLPVPITGR